jgi:CheY-like chemotaxis protein
MRMSATRPVLLHVDDDRGDLQLLREAVADCGTAVDVVSLASGEAALAHLRRLGDEAPARPNLILLDLNLRGMQGTEVLRAIKADAALAGIATVILTTSSRPSDRETCERLGADGYHVKPGSYQDLLDLVRALDRDHLSPPTN